MQVLISLEIVICFNLKYAIDFEKVINTANKKKKKKTREDFHGSLSIVFQCRHMGQVQSAELFIWKGMLAWLMTLAMLRAVEMTGP